MLIFPYKLSSQQHTFRSDAYLADFGDGYLEGAVRLRVSDKVM